VTTSPYHWRAAPACLETSNGLHYHLADGTSHRALCGADILTAPEADRPPRDHCCRTCTREAWLRGHEKPPVSEPLARDTVTARLI
jgi:hypothetical protein